MCFDLGTVTVPVENRSVALDTCRLRLIQSLFLTFSRITSERLVRSGWEKHQSMCFDLGRMTVPNENQAIGTWHIPTGTNLILAFRKRRNDDGACHWSIGGTWHMPPREGLQKCSRAPGGQTRGSTEPKLAGHMHAALT